MTGYQGYAPVGIHADASGQLTVTGWANARFVASGVQNLTKGLDVALVGVNATGAPRTNYGRGDGTAVWNNPALSNDRIDAIRFDHSGRIVLAGYSDGSGISDYLLSRLTPDGALDPTYGSGGRLNPQQLARFIGIARAVQQPDDATVVASGEAFGSFGSVRAVTVFRANANGSVDAAFKPNPLPAGPNAALALGVRPDGRLVYGTNDPYAVPNTPGFYVLQQFLPDGSPDPRSGPTGASRFPPTSPTIRSTPISWCSPMAASSSWCVRRKACACTRSMRAARRLRHLEPAAN